MNIFDLDEAIPNLQFLFNEAHAWIGKEVYIKRMQRKGVVVEMKRNKVGYGLLIDCHGFFLHLTKPQFPKWIELKPDQIQLPVMH